MFKEFTSTTVHKHVRCDQLMGKAEPGRKIGKRSGLGKAEKRVCFIFNIFLLSFYQTYSTYTLLDLNI